MCYDISFTSTIETLQDYFPDLVYDEQLELDYDSMVHAMGNFVYPDWPIIYVPKDETRPHLRRMSWAVIEYYAGKKLEKNPDVKAFYKDLSKRRNNFLNARSERILDDKKSYWYQIRNRRCLIPVTGIYEHRKITGWPNMVPYLIWPKTQKTFFLPGLYSVARLPDPDTGEVVDVWTFTLITRKANDGMENIHNHGDNKYRMPLFLPFDKSKRWLDADLTEEEYRAILDTEIPFSDLDYRTVFTIRGRKPRPDGLRKDAAWAWGEPPLGEGNPVEDD
ncbi:SOS response-associated peptidase [Dinghuibacter silviterrae]|uniref:Abasic site processing protein n=1 Tax=Dinghuibacter silviterrae TaxID=1539049 RepID=A0A4R8DV67_9BACT|nr:SOS response-associated peptidase family protein [Dinghuibacter silviterrae]TDX02079.1 putative SOS response-associated peptidase YedK [Dinghuibacter silviterrae]